MNETTVKQVAEEIAQTWEESILPELEDYIRIPNQSPSFDPDWKKHGYMDEAMALILKWCERQPIKGMQIELLQLEDRTPLLFIEIPGQSDDTALLYGHMDKQPEMEGWDEGKGPWKPVRIGDKLYGRGGADDGYAVFSALTAIAALQRHNIPHARCVVIIEACEESGSYDLPHYLTHLADRVGNPSLVIALDSGAANYDQMWSTTSLRGVIGGNLQIKVLTEGIHSGLGSGIAPSCFMILRQLLDRIEDPLTGEVLLPKLQADIPEQRVKQAELTAAIVQDAFIEGHPFADNAQPVTQDVTELLLNRSWRAKLSVTGADGLPRIAQAGNVTLPTLNVKLSLRLPPTCKAKDANAALQAELERDPPFGATVTYQRDPMGSGWHAPELAPWLEAACDNASQQFFGKPTAYIGEGGSIPFMAMLGRRYPEAQFLITGVLGPHSNAHGPNEFLHIPMGKKITGCVASVLEAHFARNV